MNFCHEESSCNNMISGSVFSNSPIQNPASERSERAINFCHFVTASIFVFNSCLKGILKLENFLRMTGTLL